MKLTKAQLLTALRDIIAVIEADDSLEGGIAYTAMEPGLKPGEFSVTASWRHGNSNGQGGCTMIRATDAAIVRIPLEEAHGWHGKPPKELANATVLIWSGVGGSWWKPGAKGYTSNRCEAGQWTLKDAYIQTCHCGPDKKISFEVVSTL